MNGDYTIEGLILVGGLLALIGLSFFVGMVVQSQWSIL